MTPKRLPAILGELADMSEPARGGLAGLEELVDPLLADWRVAAMEADSAYAAWCRRRDRDSFAVYRACADRADAAQDALATRAQV